MSDSDRLQLLRLRKRKAEAVAAQERNTVIGSPPAGDQPLGVFPEDTGESAQFNPQQQVVRDFVESDISSNVAEYIGLAGKIGLSAPLTLPTGFKGNVASAALFGGIDALEEGVKSFAFGEGTQEATKRGVIQGGISAGSELALGGLFNLGGKALKSDLVLGAGKKLAKSNAAKETIEVLGKSKRAIKDKYAVFSESLSKSTKKIREGLSGGLRNVDSEIATLDDSISKLTLSLNKPVAEGVGSVKKLISKGYDALLDSDIGAKSLDISDNLADMVQTLKVDSAVGNKDRVKALYNLFLERVDDPSIKKQIQAKMKDLIEREGADVTLRDAHTLRRSLEAIGSKMKKDPLTQELGFELVGKARALSDSIDGQVGGAYSELSTRWREMKQVEEAVDSSVGRLRTLFGDSRRKGSKKIQSKISKAAKEGLEITDDMIKEQDDTVTALFAQADLLDKNGLTKEAGMLRENLTELSSSLIKKNEIKGSRDLIFKLAKETNEENVVSLGNIIKNIELDSGKSLSELTGSLSKKNSDDVLRAQKRINSLSNRLKKGKKLDASKTRQIENEIASLKDNILPGAHRLSTNLIIAGTLGGALKLAGLPNSVSALIPTTVLLASSYPQLSRAMGKVVESNISKAALSEPVRRGLIKLNTRLFQGIAQSELEQQ